MRLIGGNISDTPVKEIGDGSAFNVGGAAGDPALVTLGTWSSVAAISATNWSQRADSVDLIHSAIYGIPNQLTRMSATSLLRSWVEVSSGDCMVGEIVLNADGTVASVATANDLSSDLGSDLVQFIVRKVPGSSTRIVISRPNKETANSSGTPTHKFGTFDLSSGSLSKHGAVITQAATGGGDTNANHAVAAMGMELTLTDSDYGILFAQDTSTSVTAWPIKFTTGGGGQEFGTVHQGSAGLQGGGNFGGPSWLSPDTNNRIYSKMGTQLQRWDLTEADPPTCADTDLDGPATQDSKGIHWSVTKRDHVLLPPDDPDDGTFAVFGTHSEGGGATEMRFLFFDPADEVTQYGYSLVTETFGLDSWNPGTSIPDNNHMDHCLVQIDTVGDWHRCVLVGPNDTTGLYALPINVNIAKKSYHRAAAISLTTNLTPHSNNGNGMDATFNGSNILIICEDTAAAPSTITLPITV